MAIGRCQLDITARPRRAGAEFILRMRADRADTEQAIHDLAATINMRATLTPIAAADDGDGEGK